jgi:hypothetical protein
MRLSLASIVICTSTLAGAAYAQQNILVPPKQSIAGTPQVDWSYKWWQWAFSFDRVRSPVADQTGAMCASRQSGDVWFLAGTYGTKRVVRACTVPFGKTLFFPLINYVAFRAEQSTEPCMSLAARASALVNEPSALILEVDGKRYENLSRHRLATPCFSVVPGEKPDAVSDGYYVAIQPLPRGKHILNFGGALPTLMQAVTYTLIVE